MMRQLLRDNLEFVRQFRQRFETTGAVLPSSRFLARAMTGPLRERIAATQSNVVPLRILEVGPGTGAVTRAVVRHVREGDRLDLVEINDSFANHLRERFASDPEWQSVANRAQVHVCPLQEFEVSEPYDIIISGLPFNNFPAALVEELLDSCFELLAPGGSLSFFEYMYIRPARLLVTRGEEQKRLRAIEDHLQGRFASHRFRRNWVFVNVPPAWVQHLSKEPQ